MTVETTKRCGGSGRHYGVGHLGLGALGRFAKPCPGCPDCRPCTRCEGEGTWTDPGGYGPQTVGMEPQPGKVHTCPRCHGTGVEPPSVMDRTAADALEYGP